MKTPEGVALVSGRSDVTTKAPPSAPSLQSQSSTSSRRALSLSSSSAAACQNVCGRCNLPVYYAERRLANRRAWHVACFTCRVCKVKLDSTRVTTHLNEIFCHRCYGRTFGPRGYGFGLNGRTMSMTFTAMQDPSIECVYHNPATGLGDEESIKYSSVSHNSKDITFAKTYAHDNVITSNVPLTGIAHALPNLLQDSRFNRHLLGTTKCSSFPPNTLSVIPKMTRPTPTVTASGNDDADPTTNFLRQSETGAPCSSCQASRKKQLETAAEVTN